MFKKKEDPMDFEDFDDDEFFDNFEQSLGGDMNEDPSDRKGIKGFFKNFVKSTGRGAARIGKLFMPEAAETMEGFKNAFSDSRDNLDTFKQKMMKELSIKSGDEPLSKEIASKLKAGKDDLINRLKTGNFIKPEKQMDLEEMMNDDDDDDSSSDEDEFDDSYQQEEKKEEFMSDANADQFQATKVAAEEVAKRRPIKNIIKQKLVQNAMGSGEVSARATFAATEASISSQEKLFKKTEIMAETRHRHKMNLLRNMANNIYSTTASNAMLAKIQLEYGRKSLAMMADNLALVKEMHQIQTKMYGQALKDRESNSDEKSSVSDIFGGVFDGFGWAERIKENVAGVLQDSIFGQAYESMNALNEMQDAMGGKKKKGGLLGTMLGNFNPENLILKMFVGTEGRKAAEFANKALSAMPAFINNRLVQMAGAGGLGGLLGSLFGIRDTQGALDFTSKGSSRDLKAPAVFDTRTWITLNETIPGYLSRIDAGINGTEQVYYDHKTMRFKAVSSMERQYKRELDQMYKSDFEASEVMDDLINGAISNAAKRGAGYSDADMAKNMESIFKRIIDMGEQFIPTKALYDKEYFEEISRDIDGTDDEKLFFVKEFVDYYSQMSQEQKAAFTLAIANTQNQVSQFKKMKTEELASSGNAQFAIEFDENTKRVSLEKQIKQIKNKLASIPEDEKGRQRERIALKNKLQRLYNELSMESYDDVGLLNKERSTGDEAFDDFERASGSQMGLMKRMVKMFSKGIPVFQITPGEELRVRKEYKMINNFYKKSENDRKEREKSIKEQEEKLAKESRENYQENQREKYLNKIRGTEEEMRMRERLNLHALADSQVGSWINNALVHVGNAANAGQALILGIEQPGSEFEHMDADEKRMRMFAQFLADSKKDGDEDRIITSLYDAIPDGQPGKEKAEKFLENIRKLQEKKYQFFQDMYEQKNPDSHKFDIKMADIDKQIARSREQVFKILQKVGIVKTDLKDSYGKKKKLYYYEFADELKKYGITESILDGFVQEQYAHENRSVFFGDYDDDQLEDMADLKKEIKNLYHKYNKDWQSDENWIANIDKNLKIMYPYIMEKDLEGMTLDQKKIMARRWVNDNLREEIKDFNEAKEIEDAKKKDAENFKNSLQAMLDQDKKDAEKRMEMWHEQQKKKNEWLKSENENRDPKKKLTEKHYKGWSEDYLREFGNDHDFLQKTYRKLLKGRVSGIIPRGYNQLARLHGGKKGSAKIKMKAVVAFEELNTIKTTLDKYNVYYDTDFPLSAVRYVYVTNQLIKDYYEKQDDKNVIQYLRNTENVDINSIMKESEAGRIVLIKEPKELLLFLQEGFDNENQILADKLSKKNGNKEKSYSEYQEEQMDTAISDFEKGTVDSSEGTKIGGGRKKVTTLADVVKATLSVKNTLKKGFSALTQQDEEAFDDGLIGGMEAFTDFQDSAILTIGAGGVNANEEGYDKYINQELDLLHSINDTIKLLTGGIFISINGGTIFELAKAAARAGLFVAGKGLDITKYLAKQGFEFGKWAIPQAVEGAKWLGGQAVEGAKYVGGKAVEFGKWAGQNITDFVKWAGPQVVEGAKWAGGKAVDLAKYAGSLAMIPIKGAAEKLKGVTQWVAECVYKWQGWDWLTNMLSPEQLNKLAAVAFGVHEDDPALKEMSDEEKKMFIREYFKPLIKERKRKFWGKVKHIVTAPLRWVGIISKWKDRQLDPMLHKMYRQHGLQFPEQLSEEELVSIVARIYGVPENDLDVVTMPDAEKRKVILDYYLETVKPLAEKGFTGIRDRTIDWVSDKVNKVKDFLMSPITMVKKWKDEHLDPFLAELYNKTGMGFVKTLSREHLEKIAARVYGVSPDDPGIKAMSDTELHDVVWDYFRDNVKDKIGEIGGLAIGTVGQGLLRLGKGAWNLSLNAIDAITGGGIGRSKLVRQYLARIAVYSRGTFESTLATSMILAKQYGEPDRGAIESALTAADAAAAAEISNEKSDWGVKLKSFAATLGKFMKKGFDGLMSGLKKAWGVAKGVGGALWGGAKAAGKGIWNAAKWTGKKVGGAAVSVGKGIWGGAKAVGGALKGGVRGTVNAIKKRIAELKMVRDLANGLEPSEEFELLELEDQLRIMEKALLKEEKMEKKKAKKATKKSQKEAIKQLKKEYKQIKNFGLGFGEMFDKYMYALAGDESAKTFLKVNRILNRDEKRMLKQDIKAIKRGENPNKADGFVASEHGANIREGSRLDMLKDKEAEIAKQRQGVLHDTILEIADTLREGNELQEDANGLLKDNAKQTAAIGAGIGGLLAFFGGKIKGWWDKLTGKKRKADGTMTKTGKKIQGLRHRIRNTKLGRGFRKARVGIYKLKNKLGFGKKLGGKLGGKLGKVGGKAFGALNVMTTAGAMGRILTGKGTAEDMAIMGSTAWDTAKNLRNGALNGAKTLFSGAKNLVKNTAKRVAGASFTKVGAKVGKGVLSVAKTAGKAAMGIMDKLIQLISWLLGKFLKNPAIAKKVGPQAGSTIIKNVIGGMKKMGAKALGPLISKCSAFLGMVGTGLGAVPALAWKVADASIGFFTGMKNAKNMWGLGATTKMTPGMKIATALVSSIDGLCWGLLSLTGMFLGSGGTAGVGYWVQLFYKLLGGDMGAVEAAQQFAKDRGDVYGITDTESFIKFESAWFKTGGRMAKLLKFKSKKCYEYWYTKRYKPLRDIENSLMDKYGGKKIVGTVGPVDAGEDEEEGEDSVKRKQFQKEFILVAKKFVSDNKLGHINPDMTEDMIDAHKKGKDPSSVSDADKAGENPDGDDDTTQNKSWWSKMFGGGNEKANQNVNTNSTMDGLDPSDKNHKNIPGTEKREVGQGKQIKELPPIMKTAEGRIALILKNEGGYVNHKNDKGGPTNFGIAWNYNKDRLKEYGITSSDQMINLTREQAIDFYYKHYYKPCGCDNISDPVLAVHMFDVAVNSGVGRAKQFYEEARKHSNPRDYFIQKRYNYYRAIVRKDPTQQCFLKGWLARIKHVNDALGYQYTEGSYVEGAAQSNPGPDAGTPTSGDNPNAKANANVSSSNMSDASMDTLSGSDLKKMANDTGAANSRNGSTGDVDEMSNLSGNSMSAANKSGASATLQKGAAQTYEEYIQDELKVLNLLLQGQREQTQAIVNPLLALQATMQQAVDLLAQIAANGNTSSIGGMTNQIASGM